MSLEQVKPKSEIDELTQEIANVWFEMGRSLYEKEIAEKRLGALSVKAHNLNEKALKLQEKAAKEKAAMEVKLAPNPAELQQ